MLRRVCMAAAMALVLLPAGGIPPGPPAAGAQAAAARQAHLTGTILGLVGTIPEAFFLAALWMGLLGLFLARPGRTT